MPKFAIEIKTKDFAMESKNFDTREEAKDWFKKEFKVVVGNFKAELIEYNGFSILSTEKLQTEARA